MTQFLERVGVPKSILRALHNNAVTLTLLLCAGAIALGGIALGRASSSVNEACKIQSRGLIANHHLQRFFVYWDELVGLSNAKTQKQLAHEPKQTRDLTNAAIYELHAYTAIIRRSPATRKCP